MDCMQRENEIYDSHARGRNKKNRDPLADGYANQSDEADKSASVKVRNRNQCRVPGSM
jgi:hypothetical protein